MSKEFRSQLKALKTMEGHINPRKEWVLSTRASLLDTISKTQTATSHTSFARNTVTHVSAVFSRQLFSYMKPAFVSVLVFALATSGWIASASAFESLPGDKLWQVKLASEKTQIVLADISGNDQKNVELQLKFAVRRVEEIKTVSREEKFLPEEKVKRTTEGLKKLKANISSVDVVVQHAAKSSTVEEKKDVSEKAKDVSDATTKISETLEEIVNTVEGESSDTMLSKEVVAIKQAVDEVGIDVIKVAVEGAQNEEQRTAAQTLVEEKLISILSDADGALGESEEVKKLINTIEAPEEAGFLIDAKTLAITTNTTGIVPSAAPEDFDMEGEHLATGIKQVGEEVLQTVFQKKIADIVKESNDTTEKVTAKVGEIKALVEAGELGAALGKAKELRGVTAISEQTTIDIKQAVKNVTGKQMVREAEEKQASDSERIEEKESISLDKTNSTTLDVSTTSTNIVPVTATNTSSASL